MKTREAEPPLGGPSFSLKERRFSSMICPIRAIGLKRGMKNLVKSATCLGKECAWWHWDSGECSRVARTTLLSQLLASLTGNVNLLKR